MSEEIIQNVMCQIPKFLILTSTPHAGQAEYWIRETINRKVTRRSMVSLSFDIGYGEEIKGI